MWVEVSVGSSSSPEPDGEKEGDRNLVSAAWSSPSPCEESVTTTEGVTSSWVEPESDDVGPNTSGTVCLPPVYQAVVTAGVRAVENDGGVVVDRSVPGTNDKADEMVEDGRDLESNVCVTSSTLSASSCEARPSEPSFPVPVSLPGATFAS